MQIKNLQKIIIELLIHPFFKGLFMQNPPSIFQNILNWLDSRFLRKSENEIEKFKPLSSILCIDDDLDFCLYLKKLAEPHHVDFQFVGSIRDAKDIINQPKHFDAFIVDGHLPDGSGFELIAWMRQDKHIQAPIAFLSRIYYDAKSFRLLKETLGVAAVLDKPLNPNEVKHLFTQLFKTSPDTVPSELSEALADIKRDYDKSIYSKMENLEKMIVDIQRSPSYENLQYLKIEVHKLAGSSGSYGYANVSEICKIMELELMKQMQLAQKSKAQSQFLNSLDDFFSRVKHNFQILSEDHVDVEEVAFPLSLSRPIVYVVDDDVPFLEQLEAEKSRWQINLVTESDPNRAKMTLLSPECNPQVLLVKLSYQNSDLNAYNLIAASQHTRSLIFSSLGILIDQGSLDLATDIIQRGIHYVVQKPISAHALMDLFKKGLQVDRLQRYRILVIDDDKDVSQFISQVLKDMGVDSRIWEEGMNIEDMISCYQPDLICLDFDLIESIPTLTALRSRVIDQNLAILVMAVPYESELVRKASLLDIEDVLFKPIDPKVLQKKVLSLIQGQSNYLSLIEKDPLTGLFNRTTFEHYLQKRFLLRPQHDYLVASMVLLAIQDFEQMAQTCDCSIMEELLQAIANHLHQSRIGYEVCAYLGDGVFGMLIEGKHLHLLELIIKKCLESLITDLIETVRISMPVALCAGIATLSKHHSHVDQLLHRAWEALKLAKDAGQEVVSVKGLMTEEHHAIQNREVILISQDDADLKTWDSLFQRRGFHVKLESNAKDALKKILNLNNPYMIPLILICQTQSDMSGIEMMYQLKNYYLINIPVIALNHVPTYEELELGLVGVNFFEKPFGMMIFFNNLSIPSS